QCAAAQTMARGKRKRGIKMAHAKPLNIGEAALATGVSAKMIRHYEAAGLIPAAGRSLSGYRLYGEQDIHRLRFVRQARDLGFSMKQIAELLELWQDRNRPSSKVKQLAQQHIDTMEHKIQAMHAMQAQLQQLAQACHGDALPDCPILDKLASR
ncbi:MAG TPA: Cu(I)-responsive transcriptional regulator, partial [Methylophilaceae bacterium]|nr:Cu(I)-responsive transcriptional regulator [Methylophilaceae bacterium]